MNPPENMNFKLRDRIFSLLFLITGSVILSGCNTQSIMQSPPTIQFPSTPSGSAGNPAPQQGSTSGRQDTATGQQTAGSSDSKGENSSGGTDNPGNNKDQNSPGKAENSGNSPASTPAANKGQQQGEAQKRSGSAGAGEKTDDEILAEALEALADRSDRQQETTAGQTGDRLASESGAAASGPPGTGTTPPSSTGKAGNPESRTATSSGPPGTAAAPPSSTGEAGKLANNTAATSGPPGTAKGTSSSTGETGNLDRELDRRFTEFDDMILGKREALTEQANAEGASGGSSGGNYGDEENSLQTAMIDEDLPAGGTGSRQLESGGGGGGGGNEPSRPDANRPEFELPADIGPGQDDDIIARQLREAAMKEKDPELRAKLWDEYRKYKKDLQATR